MSEKKPRLSLTANKMPTDIYEILAEKGASRRLTPYIVSLVEKERIFDTLISSLPKIVDKLEHLEHAVAELNLKIEKVEIRTESSYVSKNTEEVLQGELGISENIDSEIDEEIIDVDF